MAREVAPYRRWQSEANHGEAKHGVDELEWGLGVVADD
jgi:hypothetical protein